MAQFKNTTVSDTGSLILPVGNSASRPASPSAGMIRYNTTLSETEYYDGGAWRPIYDTNPEAIGGTIVDTDIGGIPYRIHLFTTAGNSTFTVTKRGEVEYLIVAGGGGGGAKSLGTTGGTAAGCGGGAGGVLTGVTTVTPQTYTITVGAGGTPGGPAANGGSGDSNGRNGGNSVAFGLTAIGGGYGAGNGAGAGGAGGSGGGSNGTYAGGAGTAGQGYAGGGAQSTDGFPYPRGGGGGAGSVGGPGSAVTGTGGLGGTGISSVITGSVQFYAGGGGGGAYAGFGGAPGLGGGSKGGSPSEQNVNNPDATPNTGGGGGGQGGGSVNNLGRASSGGSGIVIIRYPRNVTTVNAPAYISKSTLPYNSVTSPENPAPSAVWIRDRFPGAPNGKYWIDFKSIGPQQVYCFMDKNINGGGWMALNSTIAPVELNVISSAAWETNTAKRIEPDVSNILNVTVVETGCGGGSYYELRNPSTIGISYTESMLLIQRISTLGQCSSITGGGTSGYYVTTGYKGSYASYGMCNWGDGIFANPCCNAQNISGLQNNWVMFGSGTNPGLRYGVACAGGTGQHYHMWFIR